MFLHLSVMLVTRGVCAAGGHVWQGGMHGRGACLGACVGGMHGRGGHAWEQVYMVGGVHGGGHMWQGRACMVGACVAKGVACMAGETTTAADGTHPTGMHSCLLMIVVAVEERLRQCYSATTKR